MRVFCPFILCGTSWDLPRGAAAPRIPRRGAEIVLHSWRRGRKHARHDRQQHARRIMPTQHRTTAGQPPHARKAQRTPCRQHDDGPCWTEHAPQLTDGPADAPRMDDTAQETRTTPTATETDTAAGGHQERTTHSTTARRAAHSWTRSATQHASHGRQAHTPPATSTAPQDGSRSLRRWTADRHRLGASEPGHTPS